MEGETNAPVPIIRTFAGNPLYSTIGLAVEHPFPAIGQIEISDIWERDFGDMQQAELHKNHLPSLLSMRHMESGVRICSAGLITIDANSGRKQITPSSLLKKVSSDLPSVLISPSDEPPLSSTWKRASKAHDSSIAWFKTLKPVVDNANNNLSNNNGSKTGLCQLVGVAVPRCLPVDRDHSVEERIAESAKQLVNDGAHGVMIGGLGQGESLVELESAIVAVRKAIGWDVNVYVQGMDTPLQILTAMSSGAACIASNLPAVLTNTGLALTWCVEGVHTNGGAGTTTNTSNTSDASNCSNSANVVAVGAKRAMDDNNDSNADQPNPKKSNVDHHEADHDASHTNNDNNNKPKTKNQKKTKGDKFAHPPPPSTVPPTPELLQAMGKIQLNIRDKQYRKDTKPLLEGCQCHACRSHTRAYIHHLFEAHELLGEVLLYTHNMHQLLLLFRQSKSILDTIPSTSNNSSGLAKVTSAEYKKWISFIRTQI